tara:strand:+ start:2723 stop:3388 length:666 start_codon:yes stop_codon:yes gene_type:complete
MPSEIILTNHCKIPKPSPQQEIFKLNVNDLRPSQFCVGFSEILARIKEFSNESKKKRIEYLRSKPTPIVTDKNHNLWMLDRHHRLRALVEIDKKAEAFGYIVAKINTNNIPQVLNFLLNKGWLYLYNCRGIGPISAQLLPNNLLRMKDDPFRSLVWKLKKDGYISSQPLIAYHEFQWSQWLRTRSFPPFNSMNLNPALSIAKRLVTSRTASHLAGWKGKVT